ncbi:MAG: class II fructose-1,6-bisphosphate aldolase [Bacilli bacterium]|nr:class II fructose-1,6-bisphosphate aldolase [Bacilli bacterium]
MLVNMKEMLEKAKEGKYAVAHFNINNLEWTRFILEASEESKSPVILGVSEGAIKYMGGYSIVSFIVHGLIMELNITVPVALHLDHGSSIESCKKAIDVGFTSVMIDGSKYPIEENLKMTKEVVDYAHSKGVTVEAEVGAIGGEEDGVANELMYATIEDAEKMKNIGIDFLAPALGSVHGLYKGEAKLNFERMMEIRKITNLPLVLHGGTGIPDEQIKKAIECGICKLNINTELQIAWTHDVREFLEKDKSVYDPRKVIKSGEVAMKKAIIKKLELLGCIHKA